ncbi:MAG TPA: 3',5'-cyclic-nucleotide phosphodiesterase, partial [Nitrospiria bacterium]|nr:3',5'-cyclic-nucleotide phosphodiesterase [Nitrospiria bacterium]
LKGLAVRSKHLTPALLLKEFSKIGKPRLPLFIYHMKPRYLDAIRRELKNLKIKKMIILKDGMVVDI